MKTLSKLMMKISVACFATLMLCSSAEAADLKIRVVNFKTCVEKSKLGQEEQSSFEA